MNKFYGNIGYIVPTQVSPGVTRPKETVRPYRGDWTRYNSMFQVSSDSTNDDTNVSCELSIVADSYAIQHFSELRFVEHLGARWKINKVTPQRPRLLLSIGGIWNGEQASIADEAGGASGE